MEITYSCIVSAFNFIRNSVYELENKRVHVKDLRVLMPSKFKETMQVYYDNLLPFDNKSDLIFDVKIIPHYKNEVVVFCEYAPDKHCIILNLE